MCYSSRAVGMVRFSVCYSSKDGRDGEILRVLYIVVKTEGMVRFSVCYSSRAVGMVRFSVCYSSKDGRDGEI